MKVLDVNTFQEGLERNLNRLTRLESEMKQIEITIQGLTNLEESLKGQGGEALRGYYENCHLPFLEFFNTFKASFSTVLQEMASALSTLEPDLSGFIRQEALEGEVEQGLNHAKQVTEELTNETNQIMNQVCDIVSLPNLDDSEVQAEVLKAKSHRDQTVEHLNTFDLTQTMALATIQNDLLLMQTWITNIESMLTEDVTDVNFPAEQWKAFASQNPLMIQLAARTQSMDSLIAMNSLLALGMVGGTNPYSLSSLQLNGQQPLFNFGIQGATVSTNFVSFMKKREEEVAKDLSCPAPTDVDEVKEEENKLLAFLGDVGNGAVELGKGALNVGKEVADFLILDDINTIMDADASGVDKGIAIASIIPVGKVLKGAKLVDNIIDSNVDDVVKKSNVDEVVGKGTGNVLGDGTVWENIKITQPLYEGTKIPKSFELVADGKKFWVHPNGTKHMVEYITRDATTHGMPINSQTLLSSFQNSVKNAVKEGIKYEEIMNIGNWELIFSKPRGDGLLPVIKHAVYRP
ncbi:ribonuclease YeeF family protein [Ureibacillus massiliensis]|uniref:ribonuclease YeeF family protein n=1 Tax=Ureibacillus massiliensis TaxID=292806 RepID=UPI00068DB48F|nr:LXG domain-containing protein [Ureibacillus massiliensis]